MVDEERIQKAVEEILLAIGENPDREGLKDTPKRVAKFYKEWLEYDKEPKISIFEEKYDNMVIIKDIPFNSLCEHHILSFSGKAHIGYIPNGKVIGLSKIVRILNKFSRRLQIQERLTNQVAEEIEKLLNPLGVMVVLEAEHSCMSIRGVRTPGTRTITSTIKGVFLEKPLVREEFLNLVKK